MELKKNLINSEIDFDIGFVCYSVYNKVTYLKEVIQSLRSQNGDFEEYIYK